MEGKTQEAAAAAADMSVRSARNWQTGSYPSKAHKPHNWRTRPDPFAEVFESEIVPLLAMDERRLLEARTLLSELERRSKGTQRTRKLSTGGLLWSWRNVKERFVGLSDHGEGPKVLSRMPSKGQVRF